MLAGQRKQAEELQQQLDMLRQEKEQLDSKKKRLETQYESVAGRLASVTTGEANPAHKVRSMGRCHSSRGRYNHTLPGGPHLRMCRLFLKVALRARLSRDVWWS